MSLIIFFSLHPSRMFQVHKYEDEGRVLIDHVICHMIVLTKKKNLITNQDQLFMIWHPDHTYKIAFFFNWLSKYVFTNLWCWNYHLLFQLKIKPLNIKKLDYQIRARLFQTKKVKKGINHSEMLTIYHKDC